jgi:hypothetical protein
LSRVSIGIKDPELFLIIAYIWILLSFVPILVILARLLPVQNQLYTMTKTQESVVNRLNTCIFLPSKVFQKLLSHLLLHFGIKTRMPGIDRECLSSYVQFHKCLHLPQTYPRSALLPCSHVSILRTPAEQSTGFTHFLSRTSSNWLEHCHTLRISSCQVWHVRCYHFVHPRFNSHF